MAGRRRTLRQRLFQLGSLDILDQSPIELWAAISEETERGAVLLRRREIERRNQNASLLGAELGQHVAALVANEAVAVEALAAFSAYAIGGNDRNDIADGVADHRAAP